MDISKIGFGTAAIGRPMYINIRTQRANKFDLEQFKSDGIRMLNIAYERGIRYFDTAPGYGLSEDLLISWLRSKNDPSIEVATKWGYKYTANFDPNATSHEVKEHSIQMLQAQFEQSKKLLPYLTTYQIHSATLDTGVIQNNEVLEYLEKIRSEYGLKIGLTTSGDNQIDVIQEALKNELFEVFQVTYNVLDQSTRNILNKMENKRIIIKEGLANGRIFKNIDFPQYANLYNVLKRLALKYNVGADAISLQFCKQTVHSYSILSGAALPTQLDQNLNAIDLQLSNSEIEELNTLAVSPKNYWTERKQLTWN